MNRRNPAARQPGSPAIECKGCGKEIDPRDFSRGSATQGGYCGLMCALKDADGELEEGST